MARSRKVLIFCPHEVGAYHPLSTYMDAHQFRSSESLCSRVSVEFNLQCTCPFPWRLGEGWKFLRSNQLVFLVTGLILRLSRDLPLNYLISINSGVVKRSPLWIIKDAPTTEEIPKVCVLCQEEWTKRSVYILLYQRFLILVPKIFVF